MASEMETLENKKPENVPVVESEEVEMKEKEEYEKETEVEEAKSEFEEETEEIKQSSKRGRKDSAKKAESCSKKAKTDLSSVTPIERPTRERKTVERFQESVGWMTSPKPFSIEKGSGTQLKDIPNVAYKLSKRKPDELLQALHLVLFNKRAKVHSLKKNISMFSGFVWADDEKEKMTTKLKEKLDKCTKEKLNDFCDVLNLRIFKSQLKKEELSLKVFEFLQSPHPTTDVLLAEKERKVKKQKAKARKSKTPSTKQPDKKFKRSSKIQDEDEVGEVEASESGDGDFQEEDEKAAVTLWKPENNEKEEKLEESGDEEKEKSEEDDDEEADNSEDEYQSKKKVKSKQSFSKKNVKKGSENSSTKSNKKSSASGAKKVADNAATKVSSTKKSKEEMNTKKMDSKISSKKKPSTDEGKSKTNKKAKAEPTNEEMHEVVTRILKKVDFNTATLSDIIKQLCTHFGQDLLHRKAEVKAIITDVINNMSGDEDADDAEKNEAKVEDKDKGDEKDEEKRATEDASDEDDEDGDNSDSYNG